LALTTLSAVQLYTGILTDAAKLSACIIRAESIMARHCGMASFTSATYTNEYHDGEGSPVLVLRNFPTTSSISLRLTDGTTSAAITTGYVVTSSTGEVELRDHPAVLWDLGYAMSDRPEFPDGRKNVVVTYRAGYATVPVDLAQAAIETAAFLFRNSTQTPGMQSETLGRYSYTRAAGGADLHAFLSERLGAWKRPGAYL
jgi:hypothetical protein